MERSEYGSEFHWIAPEEGGGQCPVPEGSLFYASGRGAMRAVLIGANGNLRWQRLFVPTYFCQDVVTSLRESGIAIQYYEDSPLWQSPAVDHGALRTGDAVLVVNYFGLRGRLSLEDVRAAGADVVEDHTHDPWSEWARRSEAAYCIASLRKVLPLPDGALLWSPQGLRLPAAPTPTAFHQRGSHLKLCAMLLKDAYLRGRAVPKEQFLDLFRRGEELLGAPEISEASPLARTLASIFPTESWRERRRRNYRVFCEAVEGAEGFEILQVASGSGSCPFSAIILFDGKRVRDAVRGWLIENSVYPAILWPLSGDIRRTLPEATLDFSERMLSIPCDGRYSTEDLRRAAAALLRAVESAPRGRMPTQ